MLTVKARSALDALLADHKSKLLAALQEEEQLLLDARFPAGMTAVNLHAGDLAAATNRNNTLCVELLSGSGASPRPAGIIVPELEKTIAQLRTIVTQMPNSVSTPQATSIPSPALTHEP
jgi:hypothetical protein